MGGYCTTYFDGVVYGELSEQCTVAFLHSLVVCLPVLPNR